MNTFDSLTVIGIKDCGVRRSRSRKRRQVGRGSETGPSANSSNVHETDLRHKREIVVQGEMAQQKYISLANGVTECGLGRYRLGT